ncbi:hypothetical protein Droror1_Dr00023172 [Drosera rotundifolia]
MARQPLSHPRLVGLVHALECDAVFCDDALGLGMTMMRRFAICDDAAILQGKGKQWLRPWMSLMWVGRLGCEAICRIRRILIKNAGVGSKLVRLYATNGYLEEAH